MKLINVSSLPHAWLIDIDGTIVKHNGYKNGGDELLPGVLEFWSRIPPGDLIILFTARSAIYKTVTANFLHENQIRFDKLIFDMPVGERVLINDVKPHGLLTALAVNVDRDCGLENISVNMRPDI
jgi:hypothetical protein